MPRPTRQFLNDVWAATDFIDHNWWENAAILHLIGRNLEPPYSRDHETIHSRLVAELPLRWNAVPGYIECVARASVLDALREGTGIGVLRLTPAKTAATA